MGLTTEEIRRKTNRHLSAHDLARKVFRKEVQELKITSTLVENVAEAQAIAQQVAQRIQQQAHDQIAGVVSRCLRAVFDEPYEFRIEFERKRGRTEARLFFEKEGEEIDPLTASGGGVVDIAAFALRLACLSLSKPQLRKLLILDEPFKFLSEEYRERAGTLIETLAKDMGVQFIIVTHMEEYKLGTVHQF